MNKNIKGVIPKWRFPKFYSMNGWNEKRIGQLLKIGNGRDYKHLSKGNIPVYGSGGYMLTVNDYLHDGDSVCIGRKGTINNPFFIRGKFWAVDTLFYTHSYKDCIPSFIYNIFQKIDWLKYSEASGVPSLSKTTIEKINIFVPQQEEQQKIADCLSSIDDLISAEEKKLLLLNDYKKGWMQKLFPAEGKTVPEWRFSEYKDDNNWKCVEIETVGKVITGKTPPTSNDSLWNGNIQFVTPTDIVGDKYQRLVQRTVVKTSKMKVLPKGTIMFTCIASIGKMAISVYPCVTNQQINSIITNKGYYNEFIYYSLFHNVNKIKSDLSNTTVPIINKTDFSKIKIFVTLNEKEQEKIANFLSGIDELISIQKEKIEKLKQHKKALMQGLFPIVEEVL